MESEGIRFVGLESYSTQRMQKIVVERDGICCYSEDVPQREIGIAQESVVGPMMFLIFVNDLELIFEDLNCHLVNFADDTNLLLQAVGLEGKLIVCTSSMIGMQNGLETTISFSTKKKQLR